MDESGERGHEIDRLLTDAWIPAINGETPSAAQRVERARRRGVQQQALATHAAVAPAHSSCEPEQARRELDLTVALLLDSPRASARLSALLDARHFEPEGASILACLLYLAARDGAAQCWWQLAAEAGNRNSAYCLYMHHRRYGEYRDALHWRREAARLRATAPPHRTPEVTVTRPLLPDNLGEVLIAQCHRGQRPILPRCVEAVVRRFIAESSEAGFGEIR
jgi:hypothetical protein